MIAIPSVSRSETQAADLLQKRMADWQLQPQRIGNNVWAIAPGYDAALPTILLNAHIDTVKPVASWVRNPFEPTVEGSRLYGLGSNDCGGGLVSLLQTFRQLCNRQRSYNRAKKKSQAKTALSLLCRNCLQSTLPLWANPLACSLPLPRKA